MAVGAGEHRRLATRRNVESDGGAGADAGGDWLHDVDFHRFVGVQRSCPPGNSKLAILIASALAGTVGILLLSRGPVVKTAGETTSDCHSVKAQLL